MQKTSFTFWVMFVLAGATVFGLTFGCGAAEEPAAEPRVVEVVKEVPVEKVVEKEVVKEVEVEKVVVKEVEVPAMTGPITPMGTITVAASSIATPSGWPTFAPNWQTLAMTRVQEALMHGDIDSRGNLT